MSRKLASIERITNLEPIKDKDRIELATILGWHVIVGKGDFSVGDKCVYVEYDTVLPVCAEFEFLRPRCYSSKYDGFRIRNMKMAGVFSEGIVFPLEILSDYLPIESLDEGQEVAKIMGIRKYDIEELLEIEKAKVSKNPLYRYMMKKKWFRKLVLSRKPKMSYPENITKADESNIQVKFAKLKATDDEYTSYYLTEKLEGQAAVYSVIKNKFSVFSHNWNKGKRDNSNWWSIAIKYRVENKMKEFMKLHKIKSMYIGGEIIGPGIQRNIYNLSGLDFYIFVIKNLDNNEIFSLEAMKQFCRTIDLNLVPIISAYEKLYSTSDEILERADGSSLLNKNTRREGIVWRKNSSTIKESFKAKGKLYKDWWDKKEITE